MAIKSVSTGLKHWVNVPVAPRGNTLVASFQINEGLWWEIKSILYKPPEVFLTANSAQGKVRFVTGTASELHILQASSLLDYSSAFPPDDVERLRFSVQGRGTTSAGVTVHFFRIPMKPLSHP